MRHLLQIPGSMRGLLLLFLVAWPLWMHAQSYQQLIRQAFEAMAEDSLTQAELLFRQALHDSPGAQGNGIVYGQLAAIAERREGSGGNAGL